MFDWVIRFVTVLVCLTLSVADPFSFSFYHRAAGVSGGEIYPTSDGVLPLLLDPPHRVPHVCLIPYAYCLISRAAGRSS
jgi:hypothetical protein